MAEKTAEELEKELEEANKKLREQQAAASVGDLTGIFGSGGFFGFLGSAMSFLFTTVLVVTGIAFLGPPILNFVREQFPDTAASIDDMLLAGKAWLKDTFPDLNLGPLTELSEDDKNKLLSNPDRVKTFARQQLEEAFTPEKGKLSEANKQLAGFIVDEVAGNQEKLTRFRAFAKEQNIDLFKDGAAALLKPEVLSAYMRQNPIFMQRLVQNLPASVGANGLPVKVKAPLLQLLTDVNTINQMRANGDWPLHRDWMLLAAQKFVKLEGADATAKTEDLLKFLVANEANVASEDFVDLFKAGLSGNAMEMDKVLQTIRSKLSPEEQLELEETLAAITQDKLKTDYPFLQKLTAADPSLGDDINTLLSKLRDEGRSEPTQMELLNLIVDHPQRIEALKTLDNHEMAKLLAHSGLPETFSHLLQNTQTREVTLDLLRDFSSTGGLSTLLQGMSDPNILPAERMSRLSTYVSDASQPNRKNLWENFVGTGQAPGALYTAWGGGTLTPAQQQLRSNLQNVLTKAETIKVAASLEQASREVENSTVAFAVQNPWKAATNAAVLNNLLQDPTDPNQTAGYNDLGDAFTKIENLPASLNALLAVDNSGNHFNLKIVLSALAKLDDITGIAANVENQYNEALLKGQPLEPAQQNTFDIETGIDKLNLDVLGVLLVLAQTGPDGKNPAITQANPGQEVDYAYAAYKVKLPFGGEVTMTGQRIADHINMKDLSGKKAGMVRVIQDVLNTLDVSQLDPKQQMVFKALKENFWVDKNGNGEVDSFGEGAAAFLTDPDLTGRMLKQAATGEKQIGFWNYLTRDIVFSNKGYFNAIGEAVEEAAKLQAQEEWNSYQGSTTTPRAMDAMSRNTGVVDIGENGQLPTSSAVPGTPRARAALNMP